MVNVNSFSGTSGLAEGSSIPRKHLRPFSLFSLTAKVIMEAQPEENCVVTANIFEFAIDEIHRILILCVFIAIHRFYDR